MAEQIVPTREQSELLAGLPADEPVFMVNLLQFKQPNGLGHYQRYAVEVVPHMQRVGAEARFAADSRAYIIGDGAKPWWDAILVVEYPTPQAFVSMVTSEDYLKIHVHREAALDRAELIATSSWGLAG